MIGITNSDNYSAIADKIREITGGEEQYFPADMPSGIDSVYDSAYKYGQSSMIDPTKVIEKTASGIGSVSVDDVSEIPHEVKVQLSSDTITDFSTASISVINNLYTGELEQGSFNTTNGATSANAQRVRSKTSTLLNKGTYTLLTDKDKKIVVYVYDKKGTFIKTESYIDWSATNTFTFTLTDTRLIMFGIRNDASTAISVRDVNLLLLYDEADVSTHKPNADGMIEGIASLSPYMTLLCDIENVGITMSYHKSWGMQTEYDRFWDSIQDYGNRTDYSNYFAGVGWNEKSFKPKYSMTPTNANGMFRYNGASIDLVEFLNNKGIVLDFSKCTNFSYTFYTAKFTHIGIVDMTSATSSITYTFQSCSAHTIDKLICNANNVFGSTVFASATQLINIVIEGEIKSNFNIQYSPLNKASILSIFNALSDTSTSLTLTLRKSAVNTAFETSSGTADGSTSEEWLNLVSTEPNWTISLA